eukprot:1792530-Rhodomonas_salina.2
MMRCIVVRVSVLTGCVACLTREARETQRETRIEFAAGQGRTVVRKALTIRVQCWPSNASRPSNPAPTTRARQEKTDTYGA